MAKRKAKELGDISNEEPRRSSRRVSSTKEDVSVEEQKTVIPKLEQKAKKKVTAKTNSKAAESVSPFLTATSVHYVPQDFMLWISGYKTP
jgi:hypothetical protein